MNQISLHLVALSLFCFLGTSSHLHAGAAEEVGIKLEGDDAPKLSLRDKLFDPEDGCLDISQWCFVGLLVCQENKK